MTEETEKSDTEKSRPSKPPTIVVVRETVESLAVAFILALLFKAFIAEAFVIPTGSMAPTLMGAHKDVQCECCGFQYQCGASREFGDTGYRTDYSIVGTICPLCRKPQVADPSKIANHATFSGDRILVSKLAYVWNTPSRWDVIVFKFIEAARQNYIKRCVGLPNEVIQIKEGDIFTRPNTSPPVPFSIARKPPHVVNAMLQNVHDTQYVPKDLVKAGVPSSWQPLQEDDPAWSIEWNEDRWKAEFKESSSTRWLRYYHRVIDSVAWNYLKENNRLPMPVKSRQPRIITDFSAYNAGFVSQLNVQNDAKRYGGLAASFVKNSSPEACVGNDGIHWTGDLASEFMVETSSACKSMSLLLVESGASYTIDIDLSNGNATSYVDLNGERVAAFEDGERLTTTASAATALRAGKKFRVKMANVDDQIILWVDGKTVDWSPSNRLQSVSYLPPKMRGPQSSDSDPLDGAPIGIGFSGGSATVTRAKVFRDIYYIAAAGGLSDYHFSEALRNSMPPGARDDYARNVHGETADQLRRAFPKPEDFDRNVLASLPAVWGSSALTSSRNTYQFSMEDKWYFPLGDNSAQSSDARSWRLNHTPERLMIGRAVVVFWPHYWKAPIPFLPNVQRMGLIR